MKIYKTANAISEFIKKFNEKFSRNNRTKQVIYSSGSSSSSSSNLYFSIFGYSVDFRFTLISLLYTSFILNYPHSSHSSNNL